MAQLRAATRAGRGAGREVSLNPRGHRRRRRQSRRPRQGQPGATKGGGGQVRAKGREGAKEATNGRKGEQRTGRADDGEGVRRTDELAAVGGAATDEETRQEKRAASPSGLHEENITSF